VHSVVPAGIGIGGPGAGTGALGTTLLAGSARHAIYEGAGSGETEALFTIGASQAAVVRATMRATTAPHPKFT
jgi:hypothetical protein